MTDFHLELREANGRLIAARFIRLVRDEDAEAFEYGVKIAAQQMARDAVKLQKDQSVKSTNGKP